jgi:hypothetical protein
MGYSSELEQEWSLVLIAWSICLLSKRRGAVLNSPEPNQIDTKFCALEPNMLFLLQIFQPSTFKTSYSKGSRNYSMN